MSIKSVNGSTTSQIILNQFAGTDRTGATIYNNTNKNMYVALDPIASMNVFSALVPTGGYYEVPATYKGPVSAIWSNGVYGEAHITEW